MDITESNICCGCLNKGRQMSIIENVWAIKCFTQIISDIPTNQSDVPIILLCWECSALLIKFTKFKEQVFHSYNCLLNINYSNSNKQLTPRKKMCIQKTVNVGIEPATDNYMKTNEDFTFDILKTENDIDLDEQIEEVTIKEEDEEAFSNNDAEDDKALIEVASSRRKKKKKVINGNIKKRKKIHVEVERSTKFQVQYTEVELSAEELAEERKVLATKEEYVNAMFRCEKCILSFPNPDDLKDHVSMKHDLNAAKFTCVICECSFATEVSYNYHTNKHSRRYQCVMCPERCTSKRAAAKHYDTVHCHGHGFEVETDSHLNGQQTEDLEAEDTSAKDETPSFPCEFCAKTFRWKTSLRKHVEKHSIETGQKRKPYCEPCRISFTTTSNLQKHVKTSSKHQIQLKLRKMQSLSTDAQAHAEQLSQVARAVRAARAQFACPQCERRFQWRGNLLRHLHSHAARAKGELVCEPCNRTFSSIATYQQHMKISKKHVTENDFKFMCSECGKRFANKTRLKDHVDWEHLKNYVHTCHICQKVFKSHTSLYLHRQVVHKKDNAEHLCDHCGKPFPNQAKLRSHITALHSGEAPYRCGACAARFSWHSCLSRHVRRVHKKRHPS